MAPISPHYEQANASNSVSLLVEVKKKKDLRHQVMTVTEIHFLLSLTLLPVWWPRSWHVTPCSTTSERTCPDAHRELSVNLWSRSLLSRWDERRHSTVTDVEFSSSWDSWYGAAELMRWWWHNTSDNYNIKLWPTTSADTGIVSISGWLSFNLRQSNYFSVDVRILDKSESMSTFRPQRASRNHPMQEMKVFRRSKCGEGGSEHCAAGGSARQRAAFKCKAIKSSGSSVS